MSENVIELEDAFNRHIDIAERNPSKATAEWLQRMIHLQRMMAKAHYQKVVAKKPKS